MGRRLNVTILLFAACVVHVVALTPTVRAEDYTVRSALQMDGILSLLKPGDRVLLERGTLQGGISVTDLSGTPDKPITITSRDDENPAAIRRGAVGLRLSNCRYLRLEHFGVKHTSTVGIRIDDGDDPATPSQHITLSGLTFMESGRGRQGKALHLAGVRDIVVSRCMFEGWGEAAIDIVGSHDTVVERCDFRGRHGYFPPATIQIRGGSSNVTIRTSSFHWAASEAVIIGGDTPSLDFRPAGAPYEAIDAVVAGNRFVGSGTPIAWHTAQRGYVHHNTFVFPQWAVVNIRQKEDAPEFLPCAKGRFEENLVVYDEQVRRPVTIRADTDFPSFALHRNAWFRSGGPKPLKLPMAEANGVYQVDPEISMGQDMWLRMTSTNARLQGIGADFYTP